VKMSLDEYVVLMMSGMSLASLLGSMRYDGGGDDGVVQWRCCVEVGKCMRRRGGCCCCCCCCWGREVDDVDDDDGGGGWRTRTDGLGVVTL